MNVNGDEDEDKINGIETTCLEIEPDHLNFLNVDNLIKASKDMITES